MKDKDKDKYELLCKNLETIFNKLLLSEIFIEYVHSKHINNGITKTVCNSTPKLIRIKYISRSYMDRYNKFIELLIELKKYNIHVSFEHTIYPPGFSSREYFEVYININKSLDKENPQCHKN